MPPHPLKQPAPLAAKWLREHVSYDPKTGTMTWIGASLAVRKQGSAMGSVFDGRGHLGASIHCKRYYIHRLAWLWMTGAWPTGEVDHINRDPADNRWENLRAATTSQNGMNKLSPKNKSGFKGVSWEPSTRRWKAQISAHNHTKHLGRFDTAEAASEAYKRAALRLHGEFARFK